MSETADAGILVQVLSLTEDSNPGFQAFGFAGGLADSHTGPTRLGFLADYVGLVEMVVGLVPEGEALFTDGKRGPHMREIRIR